MSGKGQPEPLVGKYLEPAEKDTSSSETNEMSLAPSSNIEETMAFLNISDKDKKRLQIIMADAVPHNRKQSSTLDFM